MVEGFHSHLEPMDAIRLEDVADQITFSYLTHDGKANVIKLDGPIPADVDPTR